MDNNQGDNLLGILSDILQNPPKDYIKELNVIIIFCSFILWLKFFITLMILSKKSASTGNRTKEDPGMAKIEKDKVDEEKKEAEVRWWYIELNDLENFPFALILFWGSRIVAVRPDSRLALCIIIPIYTFARILHTIMFANGIFFPRFLTFLISILCLASGGMVGVVDSFLAL